MDTAAVIASLDLVITADTAIAHLAERRRRRFFWPSNRRPIGAGCDRDDSPWYPTMRLFRQQTLGEWPDVFQRIDQAVADLRSAQA